jgi:thioredoxin reductase
MSKALYDCLIIGAGPAGLSTAAGLARLQHTSLVFDSGVYRNAKAKHMHNVLGWDHADPAEYRAKARQDLLSRYGNVVSFQHAAIQQVRKLDSGRFEAVDSSGNVYTGKKLCLATGVRDIMPDIPGYADCWTKGMYVEHHFLSNLMC